MTLDKARQLLLVQVGFGGGRNRQATRLIINEVVREHGQNAANLLIAEMHLDETFGINQTPAPQAE